jgi:PqqD family protein of HPr-rel-A system
MTTPSSQPGASDADDGGLAAVQEWLARVRAGAVRPLHRGDVTETDLDDELVLYDPATAATHALNVTAALIWEMCDGSLPFAAIVGELAGAFNLSTEQANADTEATIERFYTLGLFQAEGAVDGDGS